MSFKEYLKERTGQSFRKLIVVDIQPLYEESIERKFSIEDFAQFLSQIKKNVLYFYNGPETTKWSNDTPDIIADWLESAYPDVANRNWDIVDFYDKGYSFFRQWVDAGVSDSGMTKALRYMYTNRIYDSRDIYISDWENVLPEKDFNAVKFGIEDAQRAGKKKEKGLSIWAPEISISDLRNNWDNSLLCGGGMNECLKEIQILMSAFNIKYRLVDKFIY